MLQKVLTVGTSAAVVLSKQSLKNRGVKPGDMVMVEEDKKNNGWRISANVPSAAPRPEVLAWTKKFIARYRPALKALAKK